MKLFTTSLLLALSTTTALADDAKPKPVTVELRDGKDNAIGTATLTPDAKAGVAIALDLHGLPPGDHAIHVHETAKCQVTPGAKTFASAGGHFNPDKKHHGLENKEGPHAGDMQNFTVDAKGNAKVTVTATNASLDPGPHSILAGDGTALVIHEKADDMKTDPAGNAGERIACGLIKNEVKITPKKIQVKDTVTPVKIEKQEKK